MAGVFCLLRGSAIRCPIGRGNLTIDLVETDHYLHLWPFTGYIIEIPIVLRDTLRHSLAGDSETLHWWLASPASLKHNGKARRRPLVICTLKHAFSDTNCRRSKTQTPHAPGSASRAVRKRLRVFGSLRPLFLNRLVQDAYATVGLFSSRQDCTVWSSVPSYRSYNANNAVELYSKHVDTL